MDKGIVQDFRPVIQVRGCTRRTLLDHISEVNLYNQKKNAHS